MSRFRKRSFGIPKRHYPETLHSGRNILLKIEYDGTNYSGWQSQKNSRSIQDTVETALKQITGRKVRLVSFGRTDAGVHALGHIANFKTDSDIPLYKLQRGLNSILPNDIVIKEIGEVPLKFHSRFAARSKVYTYAILNRSAPAAISRNCVHHVPYKLNVGLMRREAECLVGRHNFKSFQAADAEWSNTGRYSSASRRVTSRGRFIRDKIKRSSVRTIKKLDIKKSSDLIKITVEADGFLYNMVRNIVGTLLEIGRGKLRQGSMMKILKAGNRKLAGPTAPAKGLCLMEVKY